MANTQTTVPTFVDGQVLYGAELNNSAGTGVPVFATTVTRDAGFGGAGEKALAEGQLCYLESTNVVQYYDGAAWATLAPAPAVSSALTLVSAQTITASSSFQINNCFTSTYDNYLVKMFISAGTTGLNLKLRLGTSGTPDTSSIYTAIFSVVRNLTGVGVYNDGLFNANHLYFNLDNYIPAFYDISIQNPFAGRPTGFIVDEVAGATAAETQKYTGGGYINNTTSFTDLIIFPASGTITGLIKIYGFANS